MAFVAISGVRLGSVNWQYTRGPLGLTISIVLLVESDTSPLPLMATLSAGLLFAVIRERCLDSGVVVLVSPLLYLLAPFTVTADLLGFRDNWLRSAAAQAPACPVPLQPQARAHGLTRSMTPTGSTRQEPVPTAPSARRKGKPLGFDQARQSWP